MKNIKKLGYFIQKEKNNISLIRPKVYFLFYILILGICLILLKAIMVERLIKFIIILIIIYIYQILHKNIGKIYVKIFHKENKNVIFTENEINILLNIYKYKNPIIWIIILIEELFFNLIYYLTKKLNSIYINIIYNILYNFTGFNGIKIILYKFYQILNNWKKYTIYEILFKRIYGMILSVLIFTNLIQLVLCILTSITPNIIIGIYLLLITISYIGIYMKGTINIIILEESRMNCNLIGTILKSSLIFKFYKSDDSNIKKYIQKKLNQDIKLFLGILESSFYLKDGLNYKNYLNYRVFKIDSNKGMEYANKPSGYYGNDIIFSEYGVLGINYIITKHSKIEKKIKTNIDLQVLKYCEYKILLFKLRVFYIGDVEHFFNIKETYYKLVKQNYHEPYYGDNYLVLSYDYIERDFIYKKFKEKLIKLDSFGDLKDNISFYEKLYNYLNDIKFHESNKYQNLKNIYDIDEDNECTWSEEYRDITIEQQEKYLEQELNNGRKEGLEKKKKESKLIEKYQNIFSEIDIIKNNLIK